MQALRYFVDDLNDFGKSPILQALLFQQRELQSLITSGTYTFLDDDLITLEQRVEKALNRGQNQPTSKVITDLTSEIVSDIREAFEPLKEKLIPMKTANKWTFGTLWLVGKATEVALDDRRLTRGRDGWFEDTAKFLTQYITRHYNAEGELRRRLEESQFKREFMYLRPCIKSYTYEMRVKYCLVSESPNLVIQLLKEILPIYTLQCSRRIRARLDGFIEVFNQHTIRRKLIDYLKNFLLRLENVEQCSNLFELMQALRLFINDTNDFEINRILKSMQPSELENMMTIDSIDDSDNNEFNVDERVKKIFHQNETRLAIDEITDRTSPFASDVQKVLEPLREKWTTMQTNEDLTSKFMRAVQKLMGTANNDESLCRDCSRRLNDTMEYLTHYTKCSCASDDELRRHLDSLKIEINFPDFRTS
ncbi:unnamed protein product [Rotaria sp. Silwood2]|nr:unnamed protein product [Rotaria sp. Silwood2]